MAFKRNFQEKITYKTIRLRNIQIALLKNCRKYLKSILGEKREGKI